MNSNPHDINAPRTFDATQGTPPDLPAPDSATRFENEYRALAGPARPSTVLEALLKHPAALAYELESGRALPVVLTLLAAVGVCFLAYGVVMGSFSGGVQYRAVPLKLLAGTLLSALICLPSLYIFSSLDGSRQNLPQTCGLLLLFLSLTALLLLGFAPIAWVFSQSTSALSFMGLLHLMFWLVSAGLGFRLLTTAFAFLNRRRTGVLHAWGVIFLIVSLQMSTALRPLIGPPAHGLFEHSKKFFLTHWGDCLSK